MTVMLQLESRGIDLLQQEAAELGVSVEQLANAIIRRHVLARADSGAAGDPTAFRRALEESMNQNEELLRRLAQ
jgi:hypothetical protein